MHRRANLTGPHGQRWSEPPDGAHGGVLVPQLPARTHLTGILDLVCESLYSPSYTGTLRTVEDCCAQHAQETQQACWPERAFPPRASDTDLRPMRQCPLASHILVCWETVFF